MEQDTIDIKVKLAVLIERMDTLTENVSKQEKIIEELVALANKGKGSAWVLVGIGSFVGVALSNVKTLLSLVTR